MEAFDTLDHEILLGKMKCIGFSDKTIKSFHSVLLQVYFKKKLWPLFIGRVQLSQWTLLWIGFNCPKTAESQRGGCLLLTTTSPVT